ncbi:hypothetical protein F0562_022654 [Nyssa sinensis]|uniref:Uncharacterized protein n=1 Tax=Nyssa sinensis TaxID=561372 RepID=A0A5J5BID1_9ASTE|nr:hypothetical protein F0562_022654 [Nyssa sinensis]
MNVQAHMSGQISGQVPNQTGTQLPGLPQQNGNSLSQIQSLGGHRSILSMEPEFEKARNFMQDNIYKFLMQQQRQQQQQAHEIQPKRVRDIVRRLEERLFKNACHKGGVYEPGHLGESFASFD